MSKITILARVGHSGHEIYGFSTTCKEKSAPKVSITGNILDTDRDRKLAQMDGRDKDGIESVELENGELKILVKPFAVACPFELTIGGDKYTAADGDIATDWADKFQAREKGEVKYRLYSPDCDGPRPLILFLHGGGEQGFDNYAQIYNCFGAAKLAENYPDCYVLAPQAPGMFDPSKVTKTIRAMTFAMSGNGPQGWTREYLGKVADIVRGMIADGTVIPERVYVTGMSMGGAGTLRMLNVAGDLFAAAVPICPSMTPETFSILKGLTHTRIWVTCAYLDHTYYRHKYIVDGIMALKDAGNRDARLTMFTPEDLEKYGLSIIEEETLEQKAGWNHACWVPTYYDEYGVMSWMMNQHK